MLNRSIRLNPQKPDGKKPDGLQQLTVNHMATLNIISLNTPFNTTGMGATQDFGQLLSSALKNGGGNGLPAGLQPHFTKDDLNAKDQNTVENLQDDLAAALKESGFENADQLAEKLTQPITDALGAAERKSDTDDNEAGGACGGSKGRECSGGKESSETDKNDTLDNMFDKFDKDNSGEISLDELLKGMEKADTNGDGKLSNRELKKMAKSLGTDVDTLKGMLDPNGDGKLSLSESRDLVDDINGGGGGIGFDDRDNSGIKF